MAFDKTSSRNLDHNLPLVAAVEIWTQELSQIFFFFSTRTKMTIKVSHYYIPAETLRG